MTTWTVTIHGRPVSQKNGRSIGWVNGRPRSFSSSEVKSWHKDAALQLAASRSRSPVAWPLDLVGKHHRELATLLVCYQDADQAVDADNLAAAPMDALKRAGVVSNDYWLTPLTVVRKRDASDPRVEITLTW